MRRRWLGLAIVGILTAGLLSPGVRACDTWPCCLPDNTCEDVSVQENCWSQGGTLFGGFCADIVCGGVPLACRMTGGGVDTFGNWTGTMAIGVDEPDRYTFGGQVGAPTAALPSPHGEWTHHQQSGPDGTFVFHAGTSSAPPETRIERVICSDPGWCNPARQAPTKQIDFVGTGSFRNIRKPPAQLSAVVPGVTIHWFEAHVEDLGEPGRGGKVEPPASFCPPFGSAGAAADCDCPDFYSITIHADPNPASAIIYHVHGYITGGNLQIHPPIQ